MIPVVTPPGVGDVLLLVGVGAGGAETEASMVRQSLEASAVTKAMLCCLQAAQPCPV